MQLVEVLPLKPFVGSYRCTLAEADFIDDVLDETPAGIVKTKQPRKRFIGLIAERRALTLGEIEARLCGDLDPAIFELEPESAEILRRLKPGANAVPPIFATVWPRERTVRVPADMAADLERRRLAEIVKPAKAAK